MKTRISTIILLSVAVTLIINILPLSAKASELDTSDVIQGIVDYRLKETGAETVQQWIDGEISENAGVSSEWFVIALRQWGDFDFSRYNRALTEYLSQNEVASASSREKYALALIASGGENEYITETLENSIGNQGLMSWVYGLHILNNGYTCESHDAESVTEKLLSIQNPDGGFSVMGKNGDVDSTAMTLQALAPYYGDESVKSAVDNALAFLSAQQKESGGFEDRGVENCESIAQVITALSSLGIDCKTDERFIKNGNNVFNAVARYRLPDGSFSHLQDGESDSMATVQVFYSFVAYERMLSGKTPLYIFQKDSLEDESESSLSENLQTSAESEISLSSKDEESVSRSENENDAHEKPSYKLVVCAVIAALASVVCLAMFLMKKRNVKNFVFVAAAAGVAMLFVVFTNFQSVDDYYGNADKSKADVSGVVTVSVYCDAVAGKSSHIPENGIILPEFQLEISQGDTVYDALLDAAAKNKIHLETNGSGKAVYVEGIGNIYEFDFGDLSGWMYYVNGESPSVSCGEYVLKDGDSVRWVYTLSLGENIK